MKKIIVVVLVIIILVIGVFVDGYVILEFNIGLLGGENV